jgi:PQQ-dependent catabolism-associated CXXCW motif protein
MSIPHIPKATGWRVAVLAAALCGCMVVHAQDRFDGAAVPATGHRAAGAAPAPPPQPLPPLRPPPTSGGPVQAPTVPPPAEAPGGADRLAQLEQAERQDHGVRPPAALHGGAMHGPTPTTIPGGQLITTRGLVALLQAGTPGSARPLVFDVLGGPEILPGAQYAVPAHQGGSFDDRTQREFGQYLQQVTQGRQDQPLVFYCASTQCWMSYNAALRAIRMGHRQVYWYRGGIEAWKQAGLAVSPAGGGQQPPSAR